MTIEQIIILSLIQGITEFLPISSSGHLAMLPLLSAWPDQGVMADVALHFGSLIAVLIYFWRDVVNLVRGFFDIFVVKTLQIVNYFYCFLLAPSQYLWLAIFLKKLGL